MRILLIQAPCAYGRFLNLPGKEVPLSLLYLASALKEAGHTDVGVLDLDFFGGISPYLENALRDNPPDVVGVSCYTTNARIAAGIAETVKRLAPRAKTVVGGFHASALPELTLQESPGFDYLAFGEGEQTLIELVEILEAGRDPLALKDEAPGPFGAGILPGLAGRIDGKPVLGAPRTLIEDPDAFPYPDRSLVPVREYIPDPGNYYRLPSTGIIFSRGCPFKCTYCSKSVFKNRVRYRRVDAFLDEIEHCGRDYGITDFRLEDEVPTVNRNKFGELCEAILSRGLDITWNCFSRVDVMDTTLLRLMRRAGCYHVTYGIESAVPETLRRVRKVIDLDEAKVMVRETQRAGIECKVNFVFGFPWETTDDLRTTVRYALDIAPDMVSFNMFKPLPGSPLFDEMFESGQIKHTRWEDYFATGEAMVFDAAFTESDLRNIIHRAFFWFHFRPRFLVQRLGRLMRHPAREFSTLRRGAAILLRELWRSFRPADSPA